MPNGSLGKLIRERTRDWPESVSKARIRDLHLEIARDVDFGEFAALLLGVTGYDWGNPCRRTGTRYADPTLQEIAEELQLLPPIVSAYAVETQLANIDRSPDFPRIVDIRFHLGSMIFNALNGSNPSLQRECTSQEIESFIVRIAVSIPPSRRWIVCSPEGENLDMLTRYYAGQYAGLSSLEYRYMNLFEDDNIGWIATYGVDEGLQGGKAYSESFDQFAQSLGLPSFSDYRLPLALPPPAKSLGPMGRNMIVDGQYLNSYARRFGVAPEKLVFDAAMLSSLRLADLERMFIPPFVSLTSRGGLDQGLFMVDEHFIEVNSVARLTLTLSDPRKTILQDFQKGRVFETFIHRVLTGTERIVVVKSDTRDNPPIGFLRARKGVQPFGTITVYRYTPPQRSNGFRVNVRGAPGSALRRLAESIGKSECELDLVLVHEPPPKHIMVGECKYWSSFNGSSLAEARQSIENLAGAIRADPEIRVQLGLPDGFPTVAAVFTSHSGPGMIGRNGSIVVPLPYLMAGGLLPAVESALSISS